MLTLRVWVMYTMYTLAGTAAAADSTRVSALHMPCASSMINISDVFIGKTVSLQQYPTGAKGFDGIRGETCIAFPTIFRVVLLREMIHWYAIGRREGAISLIIVRQLINRMGWWSGEGKLGLLCVKRNAQKIRSGLSVRSYAGTQKNRNRWFFRRVCVGPPI